VSRLEEVYKWSAQQTSESHKFDIRDYYWTEPVKTALFRLQHTEKALIGIQGLQGTGKSAALSALKSSLLQEPTFVIKYKWSRDIKNLLEEVIDIEEYWYSLWEKVLEHPDLVQNKLKISPITIRTSLNSWYEYDELSKEEDNPRRKEYADYKVRTRRILDNIAYLGKLEMLLEYRVVEDIKRIMFDNALNSMTHILIDMPDYNKTNLQLMSKDVDELQHMWNEFMEKNTETTFLIAVQKEIVMKKPHFFFGKVRWLDLEPLTPEQLLEAYLQKWTTYEPFTEDALKSIARLSRGVFRRFLNYMNVTIEQYMMAGKTGLISIEDMEKAVSINILSKDLELELSDVFSNTQQRMQAVKTLDMLRKASLIQKQIAENLGISEATAGKLVAKLELYNYVKRTRSKEGKGWVVSLA
jgi:hypothetical protein